MQIHWLSELELYGFDIIYHTGKSNLIADALSHCPEANEGVEKEATPESAKTSGLQYRTKLRIKVVISVQLNLTRLSVSWLGGQK